ncbi:unnamed protein product, partial [Allacma fusca]
GVDKPPSPGVDESPSPGEDESLSPCEDTAPSVPWSCSVSAFGRRLSCPREYGSYVGLGGGGLRTGAGGSALCAGCGSGLGGPYELDSDAGIGEADANFAGL